jgi:hypothetical protein
MKNTFITSALVAVLGFALASAPVTVKAQTTPTQTPAATSTGSTTPSKPAKKSGKTAIPKGSTITAISASSATLKTASGDLTLVVTPDTKFQFGTAKKNTPATVADFAAGDTVTGSYLKNADGTNTLATLRKKAAK